MKQQRASFGLLFIFLLQILFPGTTIIAGAAFMGCRNITSITLPDSVTYIGDNAFGNCTVLTSVTIPASVTYVGEEIFFTTSNYFYVTVHYGGTQTQWDALGVTLPSGATVEYATN